MTARQLLETVIRFHAFLAQKPEHAAWSPELIVNAHNERPLLMICASFTQDAEALREFGMSPGKGLLVSGAPGQGKTHFLYLMQRLITGCFPDHAFARKCAKDLLPDFESSGTSAIFAFARVRNPKGEPVDCLIDDILSERPGRHYGGPEVMYMADVITERYQLYTSRNLKTHFTTNYRSDTILERYGDKVLSRIMDMCNIVVFPPEATCWRTGRAA